MIQKEVLNNHATCFQNNTDQAVVEGGDGFSGFRKKYRTRKGFGDELESYQYYRVVGNEQLFIYMEQTSKSIPIVADNFSFRVRQGKEGVR